jgi:hypothetical protein
VNRRNDLVALPIDDPRENALPNVGIVAIEDAETGELIEIDTGSEAVRHRFAELAEARNTQLRKAFNGEAVDALRVSTGQPYVAPLLAFFKNRSRKH